MEPAAGAGLAAPPAPVVLLAVDDTLGPPELASLQAALLEARPLARTHLQA